MVRDEFRDRFGMPEERLPVIPLPVDVETLTPALRAHRSALLQRHGIDENATVFLWSGKDWLHDGAHAAIEALATLPDAAHLVLLGLSPIPQATEALVRDLGMGARVVLAGSSLDHNAYVGAADAFVLPALYDPQPLATFEAMACGLPVIVSQRSGAAQIVRERAAGIVVPAPHGPPLAEAMLALLDVGLRASMGSLARQAVLPLTPAAMTLKLVLLYRDLLAATVGYDAARLRRQPNAGAGGS
jgi:UDP-glucose:(heptosyl)LPS alpha-1,3-glucosyltransferase